MKETEEKLLKAQTEFDGRVENKNSSWHRFLEQNATLPALAERAASLTNITKRIGIILDKIRALEAKVRQMDPARTVVDDASRELYHSSARVNSTDLYWDYHRRVLEFHQSHYDTLELKWNRSDTEWKAKQAAEVEATEAMKAADEGLILAKETLEKNVERVRLSSADAPFAAPSITVGNKVTIAAQKTLILGHADDSGVILTKGSLTLRARTGILLSDAISPQVIWGLTR